MVHYRVHKSHQPVPIQSQLSPVYSTSSYLRFILIFSFYRCFSLPSGLYRSGLPINITYTLISSTSSPSFSSPPLLTLLPYSFYMPCSAHSPWLDNSNYTWRRVPVMKLLMMQLLEHAVKYTPWKKIFKISTLRPQNQCKLFICRNVKPSLRFTKHHSMDIYEELEIQLHHSWRGHEI
jgi:hypothetical protein